MMKYLDRMFGILQWLSDETEKYYPSEVVDQQAKQIRKLERDVEILKAEKLRQYEAYAEGILSKGEYIRKEANYGQFNQRNEGKDCRKW